MAFNCNQNSKVRKDTVVSEKTSNSTFKTQIKVKEQRFFSSFTFHSQLFDNEQGPLWNQCLSPLTLWVLNPLMRGVLETTLCDKVCQWHEAGWWFSTIFSTNKTGCYDIIEILLKVALNTNPPLDYEHNSYPNMSVKRSSVCMY